MKKLTKKELKSINGGFACYCNGSYVGEYSNFASCMLKCDRVTLSPLPTINPTGTAQQQY